MRIKVDISHVVTLLSSTCLLVLIGLAVFLPSLTTPPAYSAITPVSCNGPHPVSSCLDLAIDSSTLNIDIPTPTANGSFAYGSSTVNVRTNAPGYDLSLSGSTANPNPTTNPSLVNTSANANGAVIAPTDGNFEYIFTDLANSTWGFTTLAIPTSSLSATMSIWSAVPAATEPVVIKGSDNTNDSTGEDTIIRYGVNIDNNQASGTYTTQVRYSATADAFLAPTITSINPNSGSTAGGNTITITGTNFYDTTSVYIGTDECTSFTVNSPTEITCIVPANPTPGGYEVMVYANGGTAMRTSGYTYAAPATVSYVSPSFASTIAGTESGPAFTITGTGFTEATNVTIGYTDCDSFQVVSDTHIFCKMPIHADSTVGNAPVVVSKADMDSNSTITVTYSAVDYPTLQASDAYANCTTTAKLYRDERDSQLYYVKRMPDNKCWMVDNLKYANYGNLSQEIGKYLTVDGTDTQSAANYDVAKYVDPGAQNYCTGNTNIPTNTNTKCGLLYNWYAATGGTGTYAVSTNGTNVSGSICPANFRLPSAMSNGTTATSNGTSVSAADFPVLNASMNAGALTTGSTTSYPTNWQPSGTWGGTFSGAWNNAYVMSGYGYYWSSTVNSATGAHLLYFNSSNVYPGNVYNKPNGRSVRCVMEDPVHNFSYTGVAQTFTASNSGTYQIELWGASGGAFSAKSYGNTGHAGYTSGNISLTQGETLYVYVGGEGSSGTKGPSATVGGMGAIGGWNGGGNGGNPARTYGGYSLSSYSGGASGGGATDIRLASGAWNNITSLRSRIMVAGAGGAASDPYTNITGKTGSNMGLTGAQGGSLANYQFNGSGPFFSYPNNGGYGGTQTTGGAIGSETGAMSPSSKPILATAGTFGLGGAGDNMSNLTICHGNGGGGGGYYGGGGAINSNYNCLSFGGGGGSSFISGHAGSNAINTSGTHTGQPNHYSGKVFTNTAMIGGNASMPNPSGGTETGHIGNGYARITYLGV